MNVIRQHWVENMHNGDLNLQVQPLAFNGDRHIDMHRDHNYNNNNIMRQLNGWDTPTTIIILLYTGHPACAFKDPCSQL